MLSFLWLAANLLMDLCFMIMLAKYCYTYSYSPVFYNPKSSNGFFIYFKLFILILVFIPLDNRFTLNFFHLFKLSYGVNFCRFTALMPNNSCM